MNHADAETIATLRRRLANARARARYWSGNPSASGFGFKPGKGGRGNADLEYETALCDIRVLCDQIVQLGARAPKLTDPKSAFQKKFFAAMTAGLFKPAAAQSSGANP